MTSLTIYLAICLIIFVIYFSLFLRQDFKHGPDHKFGYALYDVKNKRAVFSGMVWIMIGAVSLPFINVIVFVIFFYSRFVAPAFRK